MEWWQKQVKKRNTVYMDGPLEPAVREILFQRWFDVSLDLDRQLLTISTAALGFLMTVLGSKGLETKVQLYSFLGAVVLFFLTICALLVVNNLNKKVLGSMLDEDKQISNSLLTIAELFGYSLFVAGVLCTGAFLVAMALHAHTPEKKIGAVHDRQEASSNNGRANTNAQSSAKGDNRKCSGGVNRDAKSKIEPNIAPTNSVESKK